MKRLFRVVLVSFLVFSLLGLVSIECSAQWWLTASTFGLTSVGPSWFQTGVGVPSWLLTGVGGPFWASSISGLLPATPVTTTLPGGGVPLFGLPTPTVAPGVGIGIPATPLMVAPTPGVAPGIGGGLALTPLMVPTLTVGIGGLGGVGGIGAFPTPLMIAPVPTPAPTPAIGAAFPAAMLPPTPIGVPGVVGGGITPIMTIPTPVGGIGLWPTVVMLPGVSPTAAGAVWPLAMPPVI